MSSFTPCLAMILLTVLTNISTAQNASCPLYINISEPWRNVGFCSSTCNKSDSKLMEGWYRFIGISGNQVVTSCANVQNNTNGNVPNYNLFTCNSNITYFTTCSEGFIVYYLRPTKGIYATRHLLCSNSSCGSNAYCGTVYGSCVCTPGYTISTDKDTAGCTALTLPKDCQTAACAENFLNNLDQLLNNSGPLEQKTVELYLASVMNVTSVVENATSEKLISYGNKVLAVTERLVSSLVTPTETQNTTSINLSDLEGQVFSVGKMTSLTEIPPLVTSNSSLSIDLIGISKKNNGSAAVVFVSYNNMGNILKPTFFNKSSNKNTLKTMMSTVVSATLPSIPGTSLNKPVDFTFKYAKELGRDAKLFCVYWNESKWVEDGCNATERNSTYTVCSCTHLSTFALIMQTELVNGDDDEIIELINTVGVSVGLLFLFLTILTLAVCQRGPKVTNVALLNLSISLFFAHLVFLLTQQYQENVKQSQFSQLCEVLAGVTHFLFLSAFVWMFIEAVLLHICVKNLSRISSKQVDVLNWKCMIVIGYIIPLVLVGLTSGLYPDAYSIDHCWLQADVIWAFLGPVCGIIAINFLLSCVIIAILHRSLSSLDKSISHLKHTRTLVLKTLLQFVILGCPWALGFFTEQNNMIKIIFLFLNSQQGTFIFIVHCVLNQEIRHQYRKWWDDLYHCSKYKAMSEDQNRASHSHAN
ncbi:adhesion G protein-coupled receptor E3-like isoform X1 [Hemibagrus wyckioides]|uniref:adhesion G protein-coupled receptor E3-like isoform X1 n=1 Tax=Hemibagrus wyckioides TaxID=337641 RepID=UPI00266CE0AE|nr:adhesion G protein-coupled receptor E3-like isoform X1 [Hemibagrus wyckioides]